MISVSLHYASSDCHSGALSYLAGFTAAGFKAKKMGMKFIIAGLSTGSQSGFTFETIKMKGSPNISIRKNGNTKMNAMIPFGVGGSF